MSSIIFRKIIFIFLDEESAREIDFGNFRARLQRERREIVAGINDQARSRSRFVFPLLTAVE